MVEAEQEAALATEKDSVSEEREKGKEEERREKGKIKEEKR